MQSSAANAARAASEKRLNPIKLKQMKDRQGEIEAEVERIEGEIAGHELALGNFVSIEETRRLSDLIEDSRARLHVLLKEWEVVGQAIEASS